MGWNRTVTAIDTYARHARLARTVAKGMRSAGFMVDMQDIRDASGVRLDPVNLVINRTLRVLCRPIGWRPYSGSADMVAISEGAYVQFGASAADIAKLAEHCAPLLMHRR